MVTDLGIRLRALRERAGLSARHLDRLAGLTINHSMQIETVSGANASAKTLASLAAVLGTSIDYLATGAGSPPDDESLRRAVRRAERVLSRTGTEG